MKFLLDTFTKVLLTVILLVWLGLKLIIPVTAFLACMAIAVIVFVLVLPINLWRWLSGKSNSSRK